MDMAGTVEAVGEGVTRFKARDAVFGCVGGVRGLPGTLAEYVLADAAALPLIAITAWQGIRDTGVRKDDKVLVLGGERQRGPHGHSTGPVTGCAGGSD